MIELSMNCEHLRKNKCVKSVYFIWIDLKYFFLFCYLLSSFFIYNWNTNGQNEANKQQKGSELVNELCSVMFYCLLCFTVLCCVCCGVLCFTVCFGVLRCGVVVFNLNHILTESVYRIDYTLYSIMYI